MSSAMHNVRHGSRRWRRKSEHRYMPFGVPTGGIASRMTPGSQAAEYWRRVLETLGQSSGALEHGPAIDQLIEADVASWTEFREEMWGLARSFRVGGGRTAFLSNGVPEAMARIRANRPLESWFDAVVVSCEVGVAKPDPRIYQICLSRLGVLPERALFVDDRADNIQAAARLGIETLHFAGDDAVAR